ncbi:GDP-mannose 4,6-dehydratase [Microvirga sp. ACRRW]|uniref:NAD-dependent epimerase/dehydratase family protein n=1 Tax=Microvirga sp. ACRRW TaxID=2918205 RepID=UPI001EF6819A|nr:NAD-dependent epimerase/dehydratase family protein [Microvirga sp. ACRRW]MCG7392453.1 GDP-mannose 4,6-dehydratase [Microvirga sp. ACRRW]
MHSRGEGTRVLITGARGFVGPYVMDALRRICGTDVALFPTAKDAVNDPALGPVLALDITDRASIEDALFRCDPTHVIHLAGIAAPAAASADPDAAWHVNVHGTLNLARAILEKAPRCCLLNVGSGLIYGDSAKAGQPLDEHSLVAPLDDYSVTKSAADLALGAMARRGLKCVRFRPFNHSGAGQTDAYVLSAFAQQIARIEQGLAEPVMMVGNLDAERDFLDVRDVADAYALAVKKSDVLEPGCIINIASGTSRRVGDLLQQLLSLSRVKITAEVDPARYRPSDLPRVVGNADRARQILGWAPRYSIEQTLAAILDDHRARLAHH